MYRLELKSQPKTFVGWSNMVVRAKSQLRFTGLWSLKNINALTQTGVCWKLVGCYQNVKMKMNFKLSLRTEPLLTDKLEGITKVPVFFSFRRRVTFSRSFCNSSDKFPKFSSFWLASSPIHMFLQSSRLFNSLKHWKSNKENKPTDL